MTSQDRREPGEELDPWRASTWAGNRAWQREMAARATPLARLEWLEAALALARAAGALPSRGADAPSPPAARRP